jgi:Mrp family chromosome partitioning ATPase
MQDLVNEIKRRYEDRYILFDAPDLHSSVDAMVLSKYIDRVLIVLEAGRVQPDKVSEALGCLEKDKILGAVLNKKE